MTTKIEPTLGRVVWYTPDKNAGIPEQQAAIIAKVNDDGTLNLTVCDPWGNTGGVQNVPLLQDGDETPAGGFYAEWMPYQKGQAAKTYAAEASASGNASTSSKVSTSGTTNVSDAPASSSSASIPPIASTGGPIPEGDPQHETVIERLEGGFEHLKEDVEHAIHHEDKPEDSAT